MSTILVLPSKAKQFDKDSIELYSWKSVHRIQEFMIFHNYRAASLLCRSSVLDLDLILTKGENNPFGHFVVK